MIGRPFRFWLLLLLTGLLAAGCGDENNATETLGSDPYLTEGGTPRIFAQFEPGIQVMPLPNDVVWQADGDPEVELAPAPGDTEELAQLKALVNAQGLLGLSPNMFLTVPVTGAVDSATLELLALRTDDPQLPVFLAALAGGDPAGAQDALGQMEVRTRDHFIVATDDGVLKLLPRTPFSPGAGYVVVVRKTLQDPLGFSVHSSLTMEALKSPEPFGADSPFASLETLRAAFNEGSPSLFDIVAAVSGGVTATPWTRDEVLVLWTFQTAAATLSLTPDLPGNDLVDYPASTADPFSAAAADLRLLGSVFTANDLRWLDLSSGIPAPAPGPVGIPAEVFLAGSGIPTTGVGNIYFGLFDSPEIASGGETAGSVPFLLTVPSAAAPAAGHPLVVFQHGITSSKEAALPLTSALAQAGFATLAIDAPLHGDRTAPGAVSGEGFFTANLLQSRAHVYQGALDLWETLDVVAAGIDLDSDGAADLDPGRMQFTAHSLGSIIGSVFLGQETRVERMILSSPPAGLLNVLDETALPSLSGLVGDLGFTRGTTPYYVFLNLAQWLLDPVDAAYHGIGGNGIESLLTVFAFGDPIVAPDSTLVFLTNLGIPPEEVVAVAPDAVGVSFPAPADLLPGAYRYGVPGQPVVHSFLISPLFDPVAEPWYAGYLPADQQNATLGAQQQAAGFLAAP